MPSTLPRRNMSNRTRALLTAAIFFLCVVMGGIVARLAHWLSTSRMVIVLICGGVGSAYVYMVNERRHR
jgi:1,4-dihydroxy-2-naphthoate octaprenyltransferase